MGMIIFTYAIYLIFGLIGMYVLFAPKVNLYKQNLNLTLSMLPYPYLFLFMALGMISGYFIRPNNDFIEPLTLTRIFVPLAMSWIIYFSYVFFSQLIYSFVVVACIGITVWLQPIGIGSPMPSLEVWQIRLIVFVLASLFCLSARVINAVPHTFIVPSIVILAGISVMGIIEACPIYFAFCSAIFIGALAAYLHTNFYEVHIEFDTPTCTAVAYLICNLLLMNLGEFCFSSCFILTAVFWAELLMALWRCYILSHGGFLAENTNYYWLASNYSAQVTTISVAKICTILLFLAWFQLFSPNAYSLPFIAIIIALWLNNSIGEKDSNKTFREINKEFVESIKQNIEEAKNIFNKKD